MEKQYPKLFEFLVTAFGEKQAPIELEKLIKRNEEVPELLLEDGTLNVSNSFTWCMTEQGHNFWRDLFYKHNELHPLTHFLSQVDDLDKLKARKGEHAKL